MNIELKEITVRDNNPTTQPPNHNHNHNHNHDTRRNP